uniref:IlGF domain-containing protein n=1 Tax=Bursaphelenchus xylophilus TaxID=6326 RepID=A0A1I7RZ27_BURXY
MLSPCGLSLQTLLWMLVLLSLAMAIPFSASKFEVRPIFNTEPEPEEPDDFKFGKLKLCPPGGRSFLEAFQLACPMRRKRSVDKSTVPLSEKDPNYRPATIDEFMHICCKNGCELTDFFPHCAPFSWD